MLTFPTKLSFDKLVTIRPNKGHLIRVIHVIAGCNTDFMVNSVQRMKLKVIFRSVKTLILNFYQLQTIALRKKFQAKKK